MMGEFVKIRTIKRRRYAKIRQAQTKQFPLTAEDLEWLNMPPVGAEFGSPECDMLELQERNASAPR